MGRRGLRELFELNLGLAVSEFMVVQTGIGE